MPAADMAAAAPRTRVTSAASYCGWCAAFRSPAQKEEGPGFKTRGKRRRLPLVAVCA
jgi:hypothetical protein